MLIWEHFIFNQVRYIVTDDCTTYDVFMNAATLIYFLVQITGKMQSSDNQLDNRLPAAPGVDRHFIGQQN